MVFMLFFMVLFFLWLNFIVFDKDLAAPAFGFGAGFCCCIMNACINSEKWSLALHWNTFWCLLTGVGLFTLASACVHWIFKRRFGSGGHFAIGTLSRISPAKCIVFSVFQICTYFVMFREMQDITSKFGILGSLSTIMAGYNDLGKFIGEDVGFPQSIYYSHRASIISGYIWFYLIVNGKSDGLKVSRWCYLNLLLSFLGCFLKGSRTEGIQLVIGCFIMYYIMRVRMAGKTVPLKYGAGVIVAIALCLFSFQYMGKLIGRNVDKFQFSEYLGIYLGAQIKNLDLYLQETIANSKIWGQETFSGIIWWLGEKLDISEWKYLLDLRFRSVNGYSLGNVYTAFYSYIHDFGYGGFVILDVLMAVITQTIYEMVLRHTKLKKREIPVFLLIYSYLYFTLAFSFFADKFYTTVFKPQFIQTILLFLLVRYYVTGIRFENFKIKLKKPFTDQYEGREGA